MYRMSLEIFVIAQGQEAQNHRVMAKKTEAPSWWDSNRPKRKALSIAEGKTYDELKHAEPLAL